MTTVTAGRYSIDMSGVDDHAFEDIGSGTAGKHSATSAVILGGLGVAKYKLTGTDLGNFDENGVPHSGTITSLKAIRLDNGHLGVSFSDFHMSAAKFAAYVSSNDVTAFTKDLLSGDDTITGSDHADALYGYKGADILNGGGAGDVLVGGRGADTLNGGTGHDTYQYDAVADSTGAKFDTIVGANFKVDKFDLNVEVTAMDATASGGNLSAATFDTDLATVIDAGILHKHHAVLYMAATGDYAGETFLIIDANGKAGYQAGKDYVIHLDETTHLGALHASDFT